MVFTTISEWPGNKPVVSGMFRNACAVKKSRHFAKSTQCTSGSSNVVESALNLDFQYSKWIRKRRRFQKQSASYISTPNAPARPQNVFTSFARSILHLSESFKAGDGCQGMSYLPGSSIPNFGTSAAWQLQIQLKNEIFYTISIRFL